MPKPNSMAVAEFLFEGFSTFVWQHKLVIFLILYMLTLSGNAIIIIIIHLDHHLHTPMYIFLNMLSISETCYTVAIILHMLSGLISSHQTIAIQGCASQLYFYVTFGINNCFLLTTMEYDCYVAICKPLRYSVIMNKKGLCAVCIWITGDWSGHGHCPSNICVLLPFCDGFVISHFCDVRPLLNMACVDTMVNEIINFVVSVCVLVLPMSLVFVSYVLIISTILKIASAEGQKKAFSTCASHLTMVIIHYGYASIIYLKPKSQSLLGQGILISVTYTVVTPLLNPVVYILRNKEVRDALCEGVGRKPLSHS